LCNSINGDVCSDGWCIAINRNGSDSEGLDGASVRSTHRVISNEEIGLCSERVEAIKVGVQNGTHIGRHVDSWHSDTSPTSWSQHWSVERCSQSTAVDGQIGEGVKVSSTSPSKVVGSLEDLSQRAGEATEEVVIRSTSPRTIDELGDVSVGAVGDQTKESVGS